MSNYTHIPALLELQEIDLKIHRLEETKKLKPRQLEEKHALLKQKQSDLEKSQEDAKKARVEVDRKELELKEKEEKVAKFSVQLNTIKTNKEYAVLTDEINVTKADISMLEDGILALLARLEGANTKLGQAKKDIADFQNEIKELEEKVKAEIAVVETELNALGETRKQVAGKIPPELLTMYEKVLNHKTNCQVLAQATDGVCQGCFMDITPQEINELMKGKDVIRCRVCSRILYL